MLVITDEPIKITKTTIEAAWRRRQKDQRLIIRDKECRGLALVVNPTGMAWTYAYRPRGSDPLTGRRWPNRTVTTGNPESLSPDGARAEANRMKGQAVAGIDPSAQKKAKAAEEQRKRAEAAAAVGNTLAVLLDDFGEKRGTQMRSWPDCKRAISNVFKKHMNRPLSELTRDTLQATADAHPSSQAAAAAVRYIRPIFRWAAKRHKIDGSLASLNPPAKVLRRDRVLTDAELAAIWQATDAESIPEVFGRLVKLLILSGQRREEVAAMEWQELSADGGVWTISSNRSKNGKPNVVPLCDAIRTILPGKPEGGDGGLVNPGQRGTPFSGWSKAKADLDCASGVSDWRIHDIRRTVATGLQKLGVRFEVTEAVLNHVSGSRSGVAGIYQQHEWTDEKAAALAAWAARVATIVSGHTAPSNVVHLAARPAA